MFLKLLITAILVFATIAWWQRRLPTTATTKRSSELSLEEAYAILGLTAQCRRADIVQSHRRLIAAVHPDKGGSNYLAAQLNAAKQRLLLAHPE